MGRVATGTVQWREATATHPAGWWARVTCTDGSRPWLPLEGGYPKTPKGKHRAKEAAAGHSEQVRKRGIVGVPQRKAKPIRLASNAQGETVAEWADRWLAARRAKGLASVVDDESRLRTHVLPLLGPHVMREVCRVQVEELVQRLDARVQAGELSWKTALNVWAVLTKMFKDACRSKVTALRVRDDNPTADVEGPDRGGEKSKCFLYPSELERFMKHPEVPADWKRLVALAVYLGVRAGELEALEWSDFDLEHGKVTVHRSVARDDRGALKGTKSQQPRPFNVEPALLPLLRAMHEQAGGKGRVVTMPRHRDLAERLRDLLKVAKVDRPELFVSDATRINLRFHDLRATHVTWSAVRGDNPALIMSRVGHEDWETMKKYLRQAEALQQGFGETFGTIPLGALGAPEPASVQAPRSAQVRGSSSPIVRRYRLNRANCRRSLRGGRDLNSGLDHDSSMYCAECPPVALAGVGVENDASARTVVDPEGGRTIADDSIACTPQPDPAPSDASAAAEPPGKPPALDPSRVTGAAVEEALRAAAAAGQWATVAQLAAELEARRTARGGDGSGSCVVGIQSKA